MGYLQYLAACFILFQDVPQTAYWGCHAQAENAQPDSWVSDDRKFESDIYQAFYENSKNDASLPLLGQPLDEKPNNVVSEMEHEQPEARPDFENTKEYGEYKREALERRFNGKRRKMMKHNKPKNMLVHGKRSKQQSSQDTDSLAEGNITEEGVRKNQETSKYVESSNNILKGGKSDSPESNNHRNVMFDSKMKQAKPNKNSVFIENKVEESKDIPDDKVENSSAFRANTSTILESEKNTAYLEVSKTEEPVLSEVSEIQKQFHTKNLDPHKNKQKDISAGSEEEETSSVKKHEKNKSSNEKYYNLNNDRENEEHVSKKHHDKSRKQNLDRLIKIKLAQKDERKHLEDSIKYANMSLINQGFLGASEKRFLALQNEADSNIRNTFEPRELLTRKPVIVIDSQSSKHLNDEENGEDEKKNSGIKKEHQKTFKESESEENNIKKSNEEGNLKLDNRNPSMHLHHTYKPKVKTLTQNVLLESERPENILLSKATHENIATIKHKRRAQKKVHKNRVSLNTDESNFEVGSSDDGMKMTRGESNTDLASDANLASLQVGSVEEGSKQRNEREITKHSHKRKSNSNHDDRSSFSRLQNSGPNDEVYDSDTHDDELSPRLEEDEREDHHQRSYQPINEYNEYQSKYFNSKGTRNEEELENIDLEDDSKKLYARRAHESRYYAGDGGTTESCVEYKAERPLTTCASPTVKTTPVCKVQTTCAGKSTTTIKAKTTSKANTKSQPTKKPDSKSGQNSTADGVVDAYEQFLCGQSADSFVNAVFEKVKRSKKIMKELGFNNDTDDTCDRCIEMKPSKIPDLEKMKNALGKCQKGVGSKQKCPKCYSVPKPMESFLNLLLSFEQEHESSVYNKIRDESSFIFTGDYPDSLTRNDNEMAMSDKFNGEREDFNKDTFEKQHLREESNEEKSDDQTGNRNVAENIKYTTLTEEKRVVDESTEAIIEENDDEEIETETESNDDKPGKEIKDESGEQNPLQTDENVKGNDVIEVFDTHDLSPRVRSKYSTYKDVGAEYDGPVKQRRKVYKNDKQSLQHGHRISKELDMKAGKQMDSKPNGIRTLGFFDPFLSKGALNQHGDTQRDALVDSSRVNPYGQMGSFKDDRIQNIENNKFQPSRTRPENSLNTYSKANNYFGYPHEELRNGKQFQQNGNYKHHYAVPDTFVNSGDWENNEYQLYPNQPGENLVGNSLNSASRPRNYKNGYDELRMVKRDAEPQYDDESIFLEVPDIEYDLY